jgi:hypothetical protein
MYVTRKRGDGRYYFALWQTNNNTPNKLLLSESAVSCLLRVRSVSFTSRAQGCIKFVPHSCLVSLSHKVGVFLEEVICYFIYGKFAVMLRLSINWKSIKIKKNKNIRNQSQRSRDHIKEKVASWPLKQSRTTAYQCSIQVMKEPADWGYPILQEKCVAKCWISFN